MLKFAQKLSSLKWCVSLLVLTQWQGGLCAQVSKFALLPEEGSQTVACFFFRLFFCLFFFVFFKV